MLAITVNDLWQLLLFFAGVMAAWATIEGWKDD